MISIFTCRSSGVECLPTLHFPRATDAMRCIERLNAGVMSRLWMRNSGCWKAGPSYRIRCSKHYQPRKRVWNHFNSWQRHVDFVCRNSSSTSLSLVVVLMQSLLYDGFRPATQAATILILPLSYCCRTTSTNFALTSSTSPFQDLMALTKGGLLEVKKYSA